jgi:hypothetical protein
MRTCGSPIVGVKKLNCQGCDTVKVNSQFTHTMPFPCHSVPLKVYIVFPTWFTQRGRVWFTRIMPCPCHATTIPFWKRLLKATAQHSMGMAWRVWISIGRLQTACGRPGRVRLLPATTRIFTKDTAQSENGRGAAWHVWINAARHGWINAARHGHGMTCVNVWISL